MSREFDRASKRFCSSVFGLAEVLDDEYGHKDKYRMLAMVCLLFNTALYELKKKVLEEDGDD